MRFGPDSQYYNAVTALVREHRGRYDLPDLRVHHLDEMFAFTDAHSATPAVSAMVYFRTGMVIAETVGQVASWTGEPGRLLDFACGYGRSFRYTVQDFGPERVWGSEILPEAVEFIGSELGAHGLASTTDPDDLDLGLQFDVIVVVSLFSHLPEASFTRWLRRLFEHLSPSGLLAFSVHDEILLPPGQSLSPQGIWFYPSSEVPTLDAETYGLTIVSEGFVRRAIQQATGHGRYRRFPTALCFQQDLYVVPADPDRDLATLQLRRGPQGSVDECRLHGTRGLTLRGWVATQDEGVGIEHADVRLDGQLLARVPADQERPDVATELRRPACLRSGWRAEVPVDLRDLDPERVLTVTAHPTEGRPGVVWATRLTDVISNAEGGPVWVTPARSASAASRARAAYARGGPFELARAGTRQVTRLVRRSADGRH